MQSGSANRRINHHQGVTEYTHTPSSFYFHTCSWFTHPLNSRDSIVVFKKWSLTEIALLILPLFGLDDESEKCVPILNVGWVEPVKPNKSWVLIYVGFRSSTQPTRVYAVIISPWWRVREIFATSIWLTCKQVASQFKIVPDDFVHAHFPNNPRAPHRAGLQLHCVAHFVWRLAKTRYAHKFVWNRFGRRRRPKGEWHGCHESNTSLLRPE